MKEHMVAPGRLQEREEYHAKAASVKPLVTTQTKTLVMHVWESQRRTGTFT